MTEPASAQRLDICAIGNAIVDVIAPADDAFIAENGLNKGSMQLLFTTEEAESLYGRMGPGTEMSGGSAANTLAAMARLGAGAGFIGQVADDLLGRVFHHDLNAAGVRYDTRARPGEPTTARCLIVVTPDGERTMNTFLGASQFLPPDALDLDMIRAADVLYLEGYLWDPEEPRAAMAKAIAVAREAGNRVAFTLSDTFCVDRHRDDFNRLLAENQLDILFANADELTALKQTDNLDEAVSRTAAEVPLLVVTRGAAGALAIVGGERHEVSAEPVDRVVDTTGAGDLFAAGFLAGQAQGRSEPECLKMGAVCAAEIITHVGARPQADLRKLVTNRLG